MDVSSDERSAFRLTAVEEYQSLVGSETVERILKKADRLRDLHVVNVNSTYYGGGVAEILSSLTLLMNAAGIRTGWRVIQGRPDFFSITKKMHNALQGDDINLSELKRGIYEEVIFENAVRMHIDHDLVIVHDPQPLPLIGHFRKKAPWVWRCHVDLTNPRPDLWSYLTPFIESYDAVVLSLPEYAQKITAPQRFIMPAINPFSTTNKQLSDAEIEDRLSHYQIPTDLNPASDRRRSERLPCRQRRAGRREDHPPSQRPRTSSQARGQGQGDGAHPVSDDAPDGGLAGPHELVRAALPTEGKCRRVNLDSGRRIGPTSYALQPQLARPPEHPVGA